MPLDFPDLKRLRTHFDHPGMVPYREGESEADYRDRCAWWSERQGDAIQAHEVRTGRGWDKWDDEDKRALLRR